MKRENFISDLVEQAETQFRNQLGGRGRLQSEIADQAHSQLQYQAWYKVMGQVLERVESQVWDQVRNQVRHNL